MAIAAGVTVALDGLNIVDGRGTGAAALAAGGPGRAAAGDIFDSGVLSATDASFTGDRASGGAGGAGLLVDGRRFDGRRLDGRRLDGSRRFDGRRSFALPSCPTEVRVASRAGSPAELGLSRDQRMLGVAVRQVRLW